MPESAASTYDEMPYIHVPFSQTHPDRLATLATLFGMSPPALETARVLELGCASGDNLIPMALVLPGAQFIGVDLSARQIEQGRQTIAALGLSNIELRQANIADIDASWGSFDYIVAHGIYSWVPALVREKLLAVCHDNLAANGVAYVSYNTLPGWRMRGMVRDMMVYHSAEFEAAPVKVRQSRALLDFLTQSVPTDTPYGMTLRQELDAIRDEPDAYLFHDHLEEVNEPFYFHQFAAAAQGHGLQYLADANFSTMMVSNLPPHVRATLARIAPGIVRMEQYMDFVTNRTFRQTLLVHAHAALKRALDGQALQRLRVATATQSVAAAPDLTDGVGEAFRAPDGRAITVANGITKAALVVLAQLWPESVPFNELVTLARERLRGAGKAAADAAALTADATLLGNELLQCYAVAMIELRVWSPRLARVPSARPVASPLARLQAGRGDKVTNLRHQRATLDPANRLLLPLLDGTRDRAALLAALLPRAADGALPVPPEGALPAEPAALEQLLRDEIEKNLRRLGRGALLVA